MKHRSYDVVVIGGGHAGTEAAHAAWRRGVRVALITFQRSDIGTMSCNPAIGGLGKGHLVREIDALDGLMGRVADKSAIQFRLLNRKKGPAVRGPRVQADRALYKAAMIEEMDAALGLDIIEGEVIDLRISENGDIQGVDLANGASLLTKSVILTSGTFLRGLMHIGDRQTAGGRMGANASMRLADRLLGLGLKMGRLKTGTPPRLVGSSINYDDLELQDGDATPMLFSYLHDKTFVEQVKCSITHTNETTHEIIRKNLDKSALYGGMIDGIGPRYCPSIEDKVVRFADKASHQIFLEPEGLTSDLVYPNGVSTSLPPSVQEAYVRSIKGLENVDIAQPGYAIEYDFVDPVQLTSTLELPSVSGLFLAGQINGTTGYEEAAAQGLVAGLNAAGKAVGQDLAKFSRSESYIGVMIDDLTTRGVTEPYRMFTSRAEFRLLLRADNADERLTERGIALGCVSEHREAAYRIKKDRLASVRECLRGISPSTSDVEALDLNVRPDGRPLTAFEILGFKDCCPAKMKAQFDELAGVLREDLEQVRCDAIYANYLPRQLDSIEKVRSNERLKIPADLPYEKLNGVSTEVLEKLRNVRPETLSQAARIEGVTQSAIVTLLAFIQRDQKVKLV